MYTSITMKNEMRRSMRPFALNISTQLDEQFGPILYLDTQLDTSIPGSFSSILYATAVTKPGKD